MNLSLPAKRYIRPAVEELKAAVKPYRLISKKTGMQLSEYKGNTLNLIPFEDYIVPDRITVDEVIVQSTKNPEIKKTITTFRNHLNSIVERIIEEATPGSKLKNRIYKRDCTFLMEEDKFFSKRIVKEYTLPKNKIQDYKQRLNFEDSARLKDIYWNHEYTITNIIELNHKKLQKLLTSIKNVFNAEKGIYTHTIKECAPIEAVNGKMKIAKNTPSKFLEMVTSQRDDGEMTIKRITKSPQISDAILKDEYLPFRLYEKTDVRAPITKYFLKKNNLDDLGIVVIPNRNSKGIGSAGFHTIFGYISFSGETYVNNMLKKTDLVENAAHEVEHARQFSLIGRLTGERHLEGSYIQRSFEKKGPIPCQDFALFNEATNYHNDMISTIMYDFNDPAVFKEYKDIYFNSLLEKDAMKAGEKAKKDYIAQGHEFAREFSHIPVKWFQ